MATITLREIAFARSGDKGDTSNIGLVPFDEDDFDLLAREVSADRVAHLFGELVRGGVHRYEFSGIRALNFVLERALSGGVSRSLNLDAHGKSWGNLLLTMEITVPDEVADRVRARVGSSGSAGARVGSSELTGGAAGSTGG